MSETCTDLLYIPTELLSSILLPKPKQKIGTAQLGKI